MQRTSVRAAIHIAAVFAIYLSVFMLIPAAVDLYYGHDDWKVFTASSFFTGGLALAIAIATNTRAPPVSARFGFLLVNLLWITMCVAGAIPFLTSSLDMSPTDAAFEAVAGVTTTGATVISNIDTLPPGMLLWRSILQWMGGLGVIALGLFLLPFLNVGGVSYFRIESSDIDDRPFARFSTFAAGLLSIYAVLTLACALAYAIAGMTAFDAINHALTTVSTAGFSTHDASIGHYGGSHAVLWVGILFMFIGGLPFSALILFALRGRFEAALDPQIRIFAAYVVLIILAVTIYLRITAGLGMFDALTISAFNFMSVITTTGYSTTDYTSWGPFAFALAFVGMFLGGCSGSTTGGVKTYRFVILYGLIQNGIRRLIYPSTVQTVRYGDRPVDAEIQRAVVLFIGAFLFLWAILTVAISATGVDFMSSLSGALSALMNIGPGLGDTIGPRGNYSTLPDLAKWFLVFGMLLGRLEILAVLVILTPLYWSR
ncbi:MAG: TrkH family potassium uptake protein [Rhizobiaceae bacterium]